MKGPTPTPQPSPTDQPYLTLPPLTCVLVLHHLPELGKEGRDIARYGGDDDLHQRHDDELRWWWWCVVLSEMLITKSECDQYSGNQSVSQYRLQSITTLNQTELNITDSQ